MAYETINDTQVVSLGGLNNKTGKKNPTQLEGYYVGIEQRANKFNPDRPKNFYKFQTAKGDVGIYGSADLDKKMQASKVGVMTRVTATGETKDVGKGNPMKVYLVEQDRTNTLSTVADSQWDTVDTDEEEEDTFDELPPTKIAAATVAVPTTEKQARLNAMLNKHKGA